MKKKKLEVIFKVITTYEDGSTDSLEDFTSYEAAEKYITSEMPYSGGEFEIKKVWRVKEQEN